MALLSVRRLADEQFCGEGGALLFTGNALHSDVDPVLATEWLPRLVPHLSRSAARLPRSRRWRRSTHRRAGATSGCARRRDPLLVAGDARRRQRSSRGRGAARRRRHHRRATRRARRRQRARAVPPTRGRRAPARMVRARARPVPVGPRHVQDRLGALRRRSRGGPSRRRAPAPCTCATAWTA